MAGGVAFGYNAVLFRPVAKAGLKFYEYLFILIIIGVHGCVLCVTDSMFPAAGGVCLDGGSYEFE